MSYGSGTWYMGRIYEELKNYTCVWLISTIMQMEVASKIKHAVTT